MKLGHSFLALMEVQGIGRTRTLTLKPSIDYGEAKR
jgi:hypothetical protein